METGVNVSKLFQVAEIELVYKTKVNASERPKITSPRESYQILLDSWNEDKIEFVEQFKIILLNRASRVLGIYEVSSGGISSVTCDLKIVFAAAIKSNASSIILSHNHPSGQLIPSQADKNLTKQMIDAGHILDIPVLDHVIVTKDGFYSFADDGFM